MVTVVRTQSRRQSGLVCSLLVVSLLLSAAVGEECVQGILPANAVNTYGPSSRSAELPSTSRSTLYVFPSMNFSCNGTITDIRMRMDFIDGLSVRVTNEQQVVVVYFLLFHDGLNSPTRRVTHVLLTQTNTQQNFDSSRQKLTEIWQNLNPLSLPVTKKTFIGLAVPENRSPAILSKSINLSPTPERVEAHIYHLVSNFSGFEGRVLEAARTADSSQFTTQMIALPLIDVSVRPDTTTPSPTTAIKPASVSVSVFMATTDPAVDVQDETALVILLVAITATVVLVLVVAGFVVASITVAIVCWRKKKKASINKGESSRPSGEKCQVDDGDHTGSASLNITEDKIYYESVVVGAYLNHYGTPLPLPHPIGLKNKAVLGGDSNGYVIMQPSPTYDAIEDTSTLGDYTYIQVAQCKPSPSSVSGCPVGIN